jgi:diguanylate cyclase (GGDEF)-like protein
MTEWGPGESGLATWVVEHGEPQLVVDQRADDRVLPFPGIGPVEGSLIAVPLRSREGVTGVLSLERLGPRDTFTSDEFELVKLFAAQVSIALQNAEIHRAVEIRARTDDLTGLLNQGTFHDWLGRAVAGGDPFSLIMLDLDDFKLVNDAAGHPAGDEFLRRAAGAIVRAGRDSDSVFRYGGDEFAIILPATDSRGAAQVADRVRRALHDVHVPGAGVAAAEIRVSASIGVATFPVDGATAPSILLAADRACYVAKRGGRDRIILAAEGAVLGAGFGLQEPTPVDSPTMVRRTA